MIQIKQRYKLRLRRSALYREARGNVCGTHCLVRRVPHVATPWNLTSRGQKKLVEGDPIIKWCIWLKEGEPQNLHSASHLTILRTSGEVQKGKQFGWWISGKLVKYSLGITGAYASTPAVDLAWSPNQ